MQSYLLHLDYFSPERPHAAAHQKRAKSTRILRSWLRIAMQRHKRRKMIWALEAMDDRLLRDIGIYRNDITRVVDGLDDRDLRMRPRVAPATKPVEIYDDIYPRTA